MPNSALLAFYSTAAAVSFVFVVPVPTVFRSTKVLLSFPGILFFAFPSRLVADFINTS